MARVEIYTPSHAIRGGFALYQLPVSWRRNAHEHSEQLTRLVCLGWGMSDHQTPVSPSPTLSGDRCVLVCPGLKSTYARPGTGDWAAAHNRLSLMTQLLGGVGVDTHDCMGMTALHSCVVRGHLDAAAVLLRAGAIPNIENYLGWTPLLLAACSGDASVAEVLLRNGAAVESAPLSAGAQNTLRHAAALGHGAVVDGLLAMGCEKGARDVHGVDALRTAELFGREMVVEQLEGLVWQVVVLLTVTVAYRSKPRVQLRQPGIVCICTNGVSV